ncbi:MBL fold metallo-hydrolase [Streptomyces sp. NPDC018610]|uniref:MBL fold metallo-hydrolase n=1 Tax=Streptomyces sp. NPDC018610 TaxID=3365049 RepID=UPI0037B74CA4
MAGRRTVLKGALAASGAATAGATLVGMAPTARRTGPFSTQVELRWLGVAGWEIVIDGRRSILFDPYLSRMPCTAHDGSVDSALPFRPDPAAVEQVAARHLTGPPELILVSHGHFDHLADVPQLLSRPAWREARIKTVCDETVRNLLAAMGAPRQSVEDVIEVKGGEYLQFKGYTVEVFRSLHSRQPDHRTFAAGHRSAPGRRPAVLGDLVEGDTLAYQVSVDGGPRILLTGASNFVERELAGIRPDVAAVAMSSHTAVHRYVERLLDATGHPPLLLPCHHDDMRTSLMTAPQALAGTVRAAAAEELAKAAPASRVIDPRHLSLVPVTEVLS